MYTLEVRIESYFSGGMNWENNIIKINLPDEVGQEIRRAWHSGSNYDQNNCMVGEWLAMNQRGYVQLKDNEGKVVGGFDGVDCDCTKQRKSLCVFKGGGRMDASPVRTSWYSVRIDIMSAREAMKFNVYGTTEDKGVLRMAEVPTPQVSGDIMKTPVIVSFEGVVSKDWLKKHKSVDGKIKISATHDCVY